LRGAAILSSPASSYSLTAVIDCDVHQNFNSLHDLVPWLDPAFRDYVEVGGYTGFQLPNYP
jgi:hypothetical protein